MDNIAECERRIIAALDKIERHMNSGNSASSGVNQSEEMAALALRNSELLSELDRVRNELSLLKAEREDEKAELQVLNQDLEAALIAAKAEEGA
jgi:predicted  nucleic acid-binding Zn-ribbon protein